MSDIAHIYGSDVQVSPSGDLALATSPNIGVQRVYRRLLTNPQFSDSAANVIATGDYLAHQLYGAGVARKIGSPQAIASTTALIRGQMLLEPAVAQKPPPVITLTPILNGLSASIQYTDSATSATQYLSFEITE